MIRLQPVITIAQDKHERWTVHFHPSEVVNYFLFVLNRIGLGLIWLTSAIVRALTTSKAALAGYMVTLTSVGLVVGIFLSISLPTLIRPLQLQADVPSFGFNQGPVLQAVTINQQTYQLDTVDSPQTFFAIPRSRAVVFSSADRLTTQQVAVFAIGYFHPLRNELLEFELGEELVLVGENNGRYAVSAMEIRELDQVQTEQFSDASAVLLIPKTVLSRSYRALILN